MTPATEMARLFPEIQRPEPLAPRESQFYMVYREVSLDEVREMFPPIDPVDVDEANFGPCALGEENDQ